MPLCRRVARADALQGHPVFANWVRKEAGGGRVHGERATAVEQNQTLFLFFLNAKRTQTLHFRNLAKGSKVTIYWPFNVGL